MEQVKHINKNTLQVIEEAIMLQLKPVEEKLGLKFEFTGGKYQETNANLKFGISIINPDGSIESEGAVNFKRHAIRFGFVPTDLNKKFRSQGVLYKITGLNPRRHKYPISVERADGRKFKFPAWRVIAALSKNN
jgi:hypothetical protein